MTTLGSDPARGITRATEIGGLLLLPRARDDAVRRLLGPTIARLLTGPR